jgi:hypothetical protein
MLSMETLTTDTLLLDYLYYFLTWQLTVSPPQNYFLAQSYFLHKTSLLKFIHISYNLSHYCCLHQPLFWIKFWLSCVCVDCANQRIISSFWWWKNSNCLFTWYTVIRKCLEHGMLAPVRNKKVILSYIYKFSQD